MYAVAGVTGNTGSVVAEHLLGAGKRVRVIVRDRAKAAAFEKRGAEVAVANVHDTEALTQALRGADGVYALNPPDAQHDDPMGRARQITAAWTEALRSSGVKHAVFLSSVGAQHASGTGVIRQVNVAETELRTQPVPVTFIRAAYFMENWGMSLGQALSDGTLYTLQDPDLTMPMVATRDIGRVAAEALLDPKSEHRVIELEGPRQYNAHDVASEIGRIAGKPVQVAKVPRDGVVGLLMSFGISNAMAQLYLEMVEGIENGRVSFEGSAVRGKVGVEQVLRDLAQRASR